MNVDKETRDFLHDLNKLVKKHGIYIGGCGCHGSPYLRKLGQGKEIGDCLSYNFDENRYEIQTDSGVGY